MTNQTPWQRKTIFCHRTVVTCYVGLLALLLIGQFIHGFSISKLLMQCVPLLIFVPGLIAHNNHRTYSWLCFVLLLYFTAYVVELGSPLRHWTDAIGLTLTVIMFIAAMMASRYLQRWQYAQYQAASD